MKILKLECGAKIEYTQGCEEGNCHVLNVFDYHESTIEEVGVGGKSGGYISHAKIHKIHEMEKKTS